MEVRGLVLLRIADAQFGKIRLSVENNDDRGFQMQVLETYKSNLVNVFGVVAVVY